MGSRAHARVDAGSFQLFKTQWPKTHSPRNDSKKVALAVQEICE